MTHGAESRERVRGEAVVEQKERGSIELDPAGALPPGGEVPRDGAVWPDLHLESDATRVENGFEPAPLRAEVGREGRDDGLTQVEAADRDARLGAQQQPSVGARLGPHRLLADRPVAEERHEPSVGAGPEDRLRARRENGAHDCDAAKSAPCPCSWRSIWARTRWRSRSGESAPSFR